MKSQESEETWIVPPWLERSVNNFRSVCEILLKKPRKTPLMIMGDTGVGKSLFVKRFERHFMEMYPNAKVRRINVAAIPETLIESQLFGHTKGAYTGAVQGRKGLVETIDLLVLEEIGELQEHIQAKLLTFIEDKIYYPVGSEKEKKAKDIQIISTTNKREEDFRPDFYNRFFHFSVPPLYQRRRDVLYYFKHFAPEAFRELRPWETMTLLCHNWPGNVREIETFALEIALQKAKRPEGKNIPGLRSSFHDAADYTQTSLSPNWCQNFRKSLEMNGVDVRCLERNLNRFGLGLDVKSTKTPFKNDELCIGLSNLDIGMEFFKSLFRKYGNVNANLLAERTDYRIPLFLPLKYINSPSAKDEKLVRDCLRYIGQSYADSVSLEALMKTTRIRPVAGAEEIKFDVDSLLRAVGATVIDPIPLREAKDVSGATDSEGKPETEKEMLKHYYADLLKRERGNVSKVAKLAGVKRSTLIDRLKELGIKVSVYRHDSRYSDNMEVSEVTGG